MSLNLGTDEILIDLVPPGHIAALSHLAVDAGLSSIVGKAAFCQIDWSQCGGDRRFAAGFGAHGRFCIRRSVRELAGDGSRRARVAQHSLAEVIQCVERIAALVGEKARGREIVADMQVKLDVVAAQAELIPASKHQVVLTFSFSGAFGRADGMFHDMCAGGVNSAAKAGLTKEQPLSKEQIVRLNPDAILLPTWNSDEKDDSKSFRVGVRSDPAYQMLRAVRENRRAFVSDRYRYSVS